MNIFDRFFIDSLTEQIIYPDKIAVALSGGCDSTALTLLMNDWAVEHSIKFTALIVDHKLRPESTSEANIVKSNMSKLGINAEILTYTGIVPTSNIEEVARNYRYRLIINFCKKNKINYVATAHNKNEQCETFLLNLIRGSGLYGLCGIPEIVNKNNVKFIRPLLSYTKDELKQICISRNQTWVEDPSNEDEKYLRVRIRKLKTIFESLGLTIDRIYKTINNMKSVRGVIDLLFQKKIEECIVNKFEKLGLIELDLQILLSSPNEIIYRVIEYFVSELSDGRHTRSDIICRIIDNLKLSLKTKSFNATIIKHVQLKLINRESKCILQMSKI